MGFFKYIFGKKPRKTDPLTDFFDSEDYKPGDADYEDIFETAEAISGRDPEVTNAVRFALSEPVRYFRENAQRYLDRGIDFNNKSIYDEFMVHDLLNLAAADELESRCYITRVSLECRLAEFRQALTKVKGYEIIQSVVEALELPEDGDVSVWTEELNAELNGTAYMAFDLETVEWKFTLAITDRETFEKKNV